MFRKQTCLLLRQLSATEGFLCEALQTFVNGKPSLCDAKTGESHFYLVEGLVTNYSMDATDRLKYCKPDYLPFLDQETGGILDEEGMHCAALQDEMKTLDTHCVVCTASAPD
jgi:hypothetical protein